jgi:hypothetical protein
LAEGNQKKKRQYETETRSKFVANLSLRPLSSVEAQYTFFSIHFKKSHALYVQRERGGGRDSGAVFSLLNR